MGQEFFLGRNFRVGVFVSFLKLFGIEEFELSAIHPKQIVEHCSQYGQGNNREGPTDRARRPSSVVDNSPDGPN